MSEKAAYEEAVKMVQLKPQMEGWKNFYENKIIRLYTQPQLDQGELQKLIKEYIYIRTQECMVNKEFALGAKSTNAHIYKGALQE